MARAMLAAVFFILILTVGATAVDRQGNSLGNQYQISETVNPQGAGFTAGELVNLSRSHIDGAEYAQSSAVDIKDENSILAVDGQDYVWHQNNGTFTVLAGGDLVGDANAQVNYSFTTRTQQQKNVLTVVSGALTAGKAMMFVFAGIIALAIVRLFAGAG